MGTKAADIAFFFLLHGRVEGERRFNVFLLFPTI